MSSVDETLLNRRLKLYWFVIFVVALGAFGLRAPRLHMRPMHTDEAVHADKFRVLLEDRDYEYDPDEYHGPTLNYSTLIPAWLSSANSYPEITEITLRIVPVAFGAALVLLTAGLANGLGFAAVVAAALAALSPAMVFYSRYYIQEMLLIFFTLGLLVSGHRYVRTKSPLWIVAAGAFAGSMHATKETAIITFGAMGLALGLMILAQAVKARSLREALAGINWLHILFGLAVAVFVSALLFSVFLRRPAAIWDSYRTYAIYLSRGGGHDTAHVHPWYYYLRILLYSRFGQGPIWTEAWIVLLAVVGLVAAVRGTRIGSIDPRLVRFVAIYTVALTVVYSALPYKTPWCLLNFLHGMILLAGVGAVTLWTWARQPVLRGLLAVLLVAAAGHLAFLTYRTNFVHHSDSRNPYVYGHPTEQILIAVDMVKEYAEAVGVGRIPERPFQVAVPGKDYWPLPWYFRDLPYVGYTSSVPQRIAPLILVSDMLEDALVNKLYVEMPREQRWMYLFMFDAPYYVWARPGVKLLGFIRKDLWDEHAFQRVPDPTELIEAGHRDR